MEFPVHSRQQFSNNSIVSRIPGYLKYDVGSILNVCFLMATQKPYLMSFINNLKEKKCKYFELRTENETKSGKTSKIERELITKVR